MHLNLVKSKVTAGLREKFKMEKLKHIKLSGKNNNCYISDLVQMFFNIENGL